ncbi:sigma-70 family RNA polymerase sigma factor [Moorena sp. SIO3A2]|uniref:RNA polymerase sigma factor n=1 Tax=Moorena sp. SIO3A2 TaxID=2607841 RepID=UPI00257A9087|nr:sigma-70 family RNA polymerase sigma factor [Moorena sp. SIO3A2]
MSNIKLEATSTALSQSHHFSEKEFWQQWQQYRDYLYHRCLSWMGGNPTDAEDALSRAMLKAWEKVQKFAGKIANFKAWLTKLTHHLCVDIHREHRRSANHVENIEGIPEEKGLVSCDDTPERALETDEKKIAIRRAIDNLPARLHQTFILHFYQQLSYREIAQQQNISYQNVCKRISQARAILREELREYFIGEDETDKDLSVTPTLAATESGIGEMSQPNGEVEPIVGETVTSSVAVAEVESVVSEEVQEEVRSLKAGLCPSLQYSESVPVPATSEEKLEVNKDSCQCVEAAVCERQPAAILALAQFDQETGSWGNSPYCSVQREQTGKKHTCHACHTCHTSDTPQTPHTLHSYNIFSYQTYHTPHTSLSEQYWGNSCPAVQKRQEESELGNGRGEFLRPSRSPPSVGKLEYIAVFNEVRYKFWFF